VLLYDEGAVFMGRASLRTALIGTTCVFGAILFLGAHADAQPVGQPVVQTEASAAIASARASAKVLKSDWEDKSVSDAYFCEEVHAAQKKLENLESLYGRAVSAGQTDLAKEIDRAADPLDDLLLASNDDTPCWPPSPWETAITAALRKDDLFRGLTPSDLKPLPFISITGSVGGASTLSRASTFFTGSPMPDPNNSQVQSHSSGTGVTGSIGIELHPPGASDFIDALLELFGFAPGDVPNYAPPEGPNHRTPIGYAEDALPANSFPASLPTKAPPKVTPTAAPPRISFAIDGDVYFFGGDKSTINGIPGGPFGTATGSDSFGLRDNYLFTIGGAVRWQVSAMMSFAVTGGFAEANKTVTYNCATYCALAGVPSYSNSATVWLPGGYVGGRLEIPLGIAALPGAQIGFDYKHVFLSSEKLTVGSVAQGTIVGLNVSQGFDLFTVRLAVPFL
jgi:hypothetical protein